MKRKILLGLTGSVASVLYLKLIKELQTLGDVEVILTEKSRHFINEHVLRNTVKNVHTEEHEWNWGRPFGTYDGFWEKNDPILHIELRDSASALVIAPCSANTLAKLANGLSDNLLTSVARAWDFNRPLIVVPAMNTNMWNHPITKEHIDKLCSWGVTIIEPQSKTLACNTEGIGALAEIDKIGDVLDDKLRWKFPLADFNVNGFKPNASGIPIKGHQGSFLFKRTKHIHTGVDLYTIDKQKVYAVESGEIVGIEDFTGTKQETPWWEDTKCMLIEGASGVVCYGEITPSQFLKIGENVKQGQYIGRVKRVLKEGKERPDIAGHSISMLHIEMYKHGITRAFEEVGENKSDWNDLIDPTQYLIGSEYAPSKLLEGN